MCKIILRQSSFNESCRILSASECEVAWVKHFVIGIGAKIHFE